MWWKLFKEYTHSVILRTSAFTNIVKGMNVINVASIKMKIIICLCSFYKNENYHMFSSGQQPKPIDNIPYSYISIQRPMIRKQ